MMRILTIVVLAAVMVLPEVQVQASILGDVLSFDGMEDDLSDDSLGVFIDTDLDGIADVIQGVVLIDGTSVTSPGGVHGETGGNLYAAYSIAIEATSVIVAGTTTLIDFEATPTGAPGPGLGVLDLLGSLNIPLSDVTTPRNAGAPLLAVFSDTGASETNLDEFTNLAASNSAIDLEYTGDATGFELLLTAGFDGVDDFYSITNTVLSPTSFFGAFDGAFTVLADEFGPGVQFVGIDDGTGVIGDIVINAPGGADGSGTFTAGSTRGFTFGDEANFAINPVPEPTLFVIFAAYSAGCIATFRRRRS